MAYQQVALELVRDGPYTPWGFRMTGGADIGTPLVIQKITYGSPSEGELFKGDIILKIRDKDASRLSHQSATDLIVKAGSTIKLVVARSMGGLTFSGMQTGVPFVTTGHVNGPQNPIFKPLPTTNFGTQRHRRSSAESYTSTTSSDTEKDLIVNQPFRSSTLILPAAKTTKDIPVGSYMRFDPLAKRTISPPLGPRDPYMLSRVQEAVFEAAQTSSGYSSPGRTPTPDIGMQNGPQVTIKQYNSPINIYSNKAIVEALAAQTASCNKPAIQQAAELLETKKMTNITESPTYQLIHEEEWKRGKVQEFEPLPEHVYTPQEIGDKSGILQSYSFKSLMHDLKGFSDF